jgi:LacI family transcriptional regulator
VTPAAFGGPLAATAQRRTTAEDIAAAAGVSVASVSRVLNNTGRVGPATRERILRIAAQLHYAPNAAARSLASRRSRTIGAVIPSLENLNFAIAIDRFRKTLREHGYTLLLANSDYDPDKEAAQIKTIAAHGVDAVMLIGASHSAQALAFLAARRVPVLLTWNWQPDSAAVPGDKALPCIGFDNFQAATRLTEYLLDLGHRSLGVIAGSTVNNDRSAARVSAVAAALARRGLPPPRVEATPASYLVAEGKAALRRLMGGTSTPRPTAVLCMNDILAYGALLAAAELGLQVPRDLSVTGFDDLDFAAELSPSLTTVHVPAEAIGEAAAAFLVDRLEGRNPVAPAPLVAQLVIRASSGPPPRATAQRRLRRVS